MHLQVARLRPLPDEGPQVIFGRKKHVKAVQDAYGVAHLWKDRYESLSRDSREYSIAVEEDRIEKDAEIEALRSDLDRSNATLTQIKAVLSDVPAFEGMDVSESLVLYLSELSRDHAELESRIDAAIFILRGIPERTAAEMEIGRLLQGGERFS